MSKRERERETERTMEREREREREKERDVWQNISNFPPKHLDTCPESKKSKGTCQVHAGR